MKNIAWILILISFNSYSYNHQKCKSIYRSTKGGGWHSSLFTRLSDSVLSSSQYVSSTGDCAANGSLEAQRNSYYAFNFDFMQKDVAKGGGENINTFLNLFGCSKNQKQELVGMFKEGFHDFFETQNEKSKMMTFKEASTMCASMS